MATLAELISRCRVKADMPVGNEFVTDANFTTWINESLYELYDLLIQKYGNNYFVDSLTFLTVSETASLTTMRALASTGYTSAVRPMLYLQSNGFVYYFDDNSTATDDSDTVVKPTDVTSPAPGRWLKSTCASEDAFPLPADFYKLLGVDLMIANTSNGWRTVKQFNFADRNNYVFPNVQIAYGVMSNLRYRIVGDTLSFTPRPASGQTLRLWYIPKLTTMVSSTPSAISPTTSMTATITGTPTATSVPHSVLMQLIYHSASASRYLAIFVDGVYRGEVAYSATTISLAAIAGLEGLSLVISADAVSHPTYGLTWTWNTGDPSSYSPAAFDQWLEYVVVDVAIKALIKEESDTLELTKVKKGLKTRIEEAAENRDAGSPSTVSDSNKYGDRDGTGYGGPY